METTKYKHFISKHCSLVIESYLTISLFYHKKLQKTDKFDFTLKLLVYIEPFTINTFFQSCM